MGGRSDEELERRAQHTSVSARTRAPPGSGGAVGEGRTQAFPKDRRKSKFRGQTWTHCPGRG